MKWSFFQHPSMSQVAQASCLSTASLTWKPPPVPLGRMWVWTKSSVWGKPFYALNSQTVGNALKVCCSSLAQRGNPPCPPPSLQGATLNFTAVVVVLLQMDAGWRNGTGLETSSLSPWSDPGCLRRSICWPWCHKRELGNTVSVCGCHHWHNYLKLLACVTAQWMAQHTWQGDKSMYPTGSAGPLWWWGPGPQHAAHLSHFWLSLNRVQCWGLKSCSALGRLSPLGGSPGQFSIFQPTTTPVCWSHPPRTPSQTDS